MISKTLLTVPLALSLLTVACATDDQFIEDEQAADYGSYTSAVPLKTFVAEFSRGNDDVAEYNICQDIYETNRVFVVVEMDQSGVTVRYRTEARTNELQGYVLGLVHGMAKGRMQGGTLVAEPGGGSLLKGTKAGLEGLPELAATTQSLNCGANLQCIFQNWFNGNQTPSGARGESLYAPTPIQLSLAEFEAGAYVGIFQGGVQSLNDTTVGSHADVRQVIHIQGSRDFRTVSVELDDIVIRRNDDPATNYGNVPAGMADSRLVGMRYCEAGQNCSNGLPEVPSADRQRYYDARGTFVPKASCMPQDAQF